MTEMNQFDTLFLKAFDRTDTTSLCTPLHFARIFFVATESAADRQPEYLNSAAYSLLSSIYSFHAF